MTIDQLIYFVSVYECQSFTKASKKNFVSQPAISSTIKKLEEELGTELFIRGNNALIPTDSGHYFYSITKPLINLFDNLPRQMEDYLYKNCSIKVGIPPMLGAFIFAPIFEKFSVRYPQIGLKLTELASKANQEAVAKGDIDVALTVIYKGEKNPDLSYTKIGETQLLFCVRKSHPYASKGSISFEEISSLPLLLLKEDSLQYKIVTECFKAKGLSPKIRLMTDQVATIKELLAYGNIGAFLFNQVIKESDDIIGIPLKEDVRFDVVLATQNNITITKPVRKFISFILENTTKQKNTPSS